MAGQLGSAGLLNNVVSGNDNPNISSDLNKLEAFDTPAYVNNATTMFGVLRGAELLRPANNYGIVGTRRSAFFYDFYERIYVSPSIIELGTVASVVTRPVSLWNAYTETDADLTAINILNGPGISLDGTPAPLSMNPLQELNYNLIVDPDGPPSINAQIQFDFSNVGDPSPIVVMGSRAVVIPAAPDVPVTEVWTWLTDIHVSVDGTEQRVGLRGMPRRSMSNKLVFDTVAEAREQYRLLKNAIGRLYVPWFQYASQTTIDAAAGATVLPVDTAPLDLRDGDYILVFREDAAELLQTVSIGSASVTLASPLTNTIPAGSDVVAIFSCALNDGLSLTRYAVNTYGELPLECEAFAPRALQRPGAVVSLRTLDGFNVLDKRPRSNDDTTHQFTTGQERIDADTGLFDVVTDWDRNKVATNYEFLVHRVGDFSCNSGGVGAMDYFRKLFDEARGNLNPFLMPTWRPDQLISSPPGDGSNSLILTGPTYFDDFYGYGVYDWLVLRTASGDHYIKVTAASKDVNGNTAISFTPALPAGAGWTQIREVNYLVKTRLADDRVTLEHYSMDTIFKITTMAVSA